MTTNQQQTIKKKRDTVPITYRLMPEVKKAVEVSAAKHGRSHNSQAEYLLKVGYLHSRGINVSQMSDPEILDKFEELTMDFRQKQD